jgi:hypothetical protein
VRILTRADGAGNRDILRMGEVFEDEFMQNYVAKTKTALTAYLPNLQLTCGYGNRSKGKMLIVSMHEGSFDRISKF